MPTRLPDVTEQAMARDGQGAVGRKVSRGPVGGPPETVAPGVFLLLHGRVALALGAVQLVMAGALLALGFVDMAMRRQTPLVQTHIPIIAGALVAVPGVLALSVGFNKNVNMVVAWLLGCLGALGATLAVIVYAALTLHFSHDEMSYVHSNVDIFVFNEYTEHDRLARGANAALLVTAALSGGICGYAALFAARCLRRQAWVTPAAGACCPCLDTEVELGAMPLVNDDDDDDFYLHTELSDLSPDPVENGGAAFSTSVLVQQHADNDDEDDYGGGDAGDEVGKGVG